MSFTYVLSTLRRRWLTVLLALLLGGLAGAAFAETTPDRYEATTSLVVSPVISNPLIGSREDVNIRTEQEILGSREVARRAAESLGLSDAGESLRGDVEVAAPLGSQILQVTVRAEAPQEAADGADAIAAAYLELRQEAAVNLTERSLEGVDQQIEELRAEPSTPTTVALTENLQQQRTSMAPSDHEPGRIIGAAVPPSAPSGPGLLITVAGAAMAGLLLGVAAAMLRERLDPWVRSADRLELAAGPLAVVSSEHSDSSSRCGWPMRPCAGPGSIPPASRCGYCCTPLRRCRHGSPPAGCSQPCAGSSTIRAPGCSGAGRTPRQRRRPGHRPDAP